MEQNELNEIERLLEQIMDAPTKAAAKHHVKVLEFKRSSIRDKYGNNASYKLSEAIISAESAAGRVADKNHHQTRAKMHLSTFKSIISRSTETQH